MKSWKAMYSNAAEPDLTDIYAYIAYSLLAPENAAGQAERIMQAVERLSTMPMRHEVYPEEPWKSMGLRYMNVDHYCIFYFPDEPKGKSKLCALCTRAEISPLLCVNHKTIGPGIERLSNEALFV